MPLTYNPQRVVVIAAASPNRFAEECKCYNVDPASPGFHLIYTPADLAALIRVDTIHTPTPANDPITDEADAAILDEGNNVIFEVITVDVVTQVEVSLYPYGTPWCIVGGTGLDAKLRLTRLFGPPQTIANALRVIEVDTAINPKLLQQTGN